MKFGFGIAVRRFVHWGLAVLIFLQIVSGYGISKYRIVESLTFGLLSKALSFKLHSFLAIPVIVFVVLHIYLVLNVGARFGAGKQGGVG